MSLGPGAWRSLACQMCVDSSGRASCRSGSGNLRAPLRHRQCQLSGRDDRSAAMELLSFRPLQAATFWSPLGSRAHYEHDGHSRRRGCVVPCWRARGSSGLCRNRNSCVLQHTGVEVSEPQPHLRLQPQLQLQPKQQPHLPALAVQEIAKNRLNEWLTRKLGRTLVNGDVAFNTSLSSSGFVAKVHSSSTTAAWPSEVEVVERFPTWILTSFNPSTGTSAQRLYTLLMTAIIG